MLAILKAGKGFISASGEKNWSAQDFLCCLIVFFLTYWEIQRYKKEPGYNDVFSPGIIFLK